MSLDEIIKTLAEIEDPTEFDRLWKQLGEIVFVVARRDDARRKELIAAFRPQSAEPVR